MGELPLGWATDLAVLEHAGSTIEDRGDHLLVRTPDNPTFHWGNLVVVADPAAVGDAERWTAAFDAAFPAATWLAIGLVCAPAAPAAWEALGLAVDVDDVLSTAVLPTRTPCPDGYVVRALAGEDWEARIARDIADNDESGEYEPVGHARFVRARAASERALCERGVAAFFGAFHAGVLVADLGIVRCATLARFQSVGTDAAHRRRGLASHLLGVAAGWAGERGCDRWVIVTEATNPAGRVYRRLGFALDVGNAHVYRAAEG